VPPAVAENHQGFRFATNDFLTVQAAALLHPTDRTGD
jgi:hypothetical protein